MLRYDELVARFRPVATIPAHIEVMKEIGNVKALCREYQEAKTKQKQERLLKKIEAAKTRAVWIFYGKPESLESIQ